ncbi:Phosphatidylinositol kinase (PIK-D) [Plasmopara halstedii]|uniref:Phosphatidylinositol kinase (PIK-D) n=1 Tax=Plasmopara halstedii TaxID=4781 RepID=A0A0P1AVN3_PLAHL|nr:Phosphatidylinositol kinase (PIK-D) [Plasmopara halstedii]CEG45400.1 Phosphatidylinositol kinase (PIK-D) [Plasmopara halstedii]|eukprot:XP_024581769.1 Phosphatidylinositol kinase (PIK-D) [Plasmopara halstedii]
MYGNETSRDSVDLSFSQILEVRSTLHQQRRYRKPLVANGRLQNSTQQSRRFPTGTSPQFEESEDDGPPAYGSGMLDSVYEGSEDILENIDEETRTGSSNCIDNSVEDDEWTNGDDGQLGQDMYRFVQPRRLSSWVQDDAVFACFKCHTVFSLLIRKHHCRACGRIFCSACSSQRVVIPGDYEATPVSPAYNSLTTNASDLIGNISWYLTSYSNPNDVTGLEVCSSLPIRRSQTLLDPETIKPEEHQENFLKEIQRLQENNVISKFTPNRSTIGSTSTSLSSSVVSSGPGSHGSVHVPDGSVMQRVCDDCASALQQRRHHYNTVKVFELCEFDLEELRTLGQVCRKWHRATIMCLSMFRQIQYYLPTHRLSEREKKMLIINRKFLGGHTKWLLQLVKAIDFSNENETEHFVTNMTESEVESPESVWRRREKNTKLIDEVLGLLQQERKHKCMLTMCSRLCKPQLGSVDALEILADETIYNHRLRALAVDALLKTATENEWWSYLHVLLHSLSIETNATGSKLGQSLIRQAQCDIRFCYDLYWGLTVMAEDPSCRRKFDGMKQRLLLTLAQFKDKSTTAGSCKFASDDVAEQLLRGQELVDLLWKIPPRIPVDDVRRLLQASVKKSSLAMSDERESLDKLQNLSDCEQKWQLLRLPVDPHVKMSGIDYQKLEVKRSAEAPMIITCIGVDRNEEEDEDAAGSSTESQRNTWSRRTQKLPHYRLMYKRDDLRKDSIVQNIINVMYLILKQETRLDIPLVTYRVLPTSSFDGLIEIVENAHTLYAIIRDHGTIMNFLHHYNGHRTLSDISSSFRESLAAYTVITFLLGVGDRHADNVMLTKDGILFHIDYGFILGKDPKPLQPPMRLDHYMIEALGGTQTQQFEQFKQLCVIAFNCLRRHVSLFMIMLTLVVKALPEITDFGVNYTQTDLEAFVIERFLPGQSDDEAATALMLRMEGKLNERIGLKLSDFVHAHSNEKTVSKGMTSVGSSVKIGVEAVEATVSTVASSLTSGASSIYKFMWGGPQR